MCAKASDWMQNHNCMQHEAGKASGIRLDFLAQKPFIVFIMIE